MCSDVQYVVFSLCFGDCSVNGFTYCCELKGCIDYSLVAVVTQATFAPV